MQICSHLLKIFLKENLKLELMGSSNVWAGVNKTIDKGDTCGLCVLPPPSENRL